MKQTGDDDGVGRNRRELIEQTLADPAALNWNEVASAGYDPRRGWIRPRRL